MKNTITNFFENVTMFIPDSKTLTIVQRKAVQLGHLQLWKHNKDKVKDSASGYLHFDNDKEFFLSNSKLKKEVVTLEQFNNHTFDTKEDAKELDEDYIARMFDETIVRMFYNSRKK